MPKSTVAWFDSLTAGVHALGTAAREYRTAAQSARNAVWHSDPARLRAIGGAVSVPGNDTIRPHDDALWRLGELYGALRRSTEALYENAAEAYAHGTAEAIRAVLIGEQPAHIELRRRDGRYVLPNRPLPDLGEELARWSGIDRLTALRGRVAEQETVRDAAREYAFFEDLTDYETPDVTESRGRAAVLADTAYAYGETAESALHFVLLAECAQRGERR